MKILVFYPYIPWPLDRGTYQRTFNLLRELARAHEVDLLAIAEGSEGREHKALFESFCRQVEFIPFEHPAWPKLFPDRLFNPLPTSIAHWTSAVVGEKLRQMLQKKSYDLVYACDLVMAQYFLNRHGNTPLVVDRSRVDLQFQLAEHSRMNFSFRTKMLRCEGYAKLWWYERQIASRAALEVVCGPDDETFLRRWVQRDMPIEVLVNGVDLDYFAPQSTHEPRAAAPTVLFCGAMDYNPNIEALRWFFAEMHGPLLKQIPHLQTYIVGKAPTVEVRAFARRKNVVVTGGVPDVRPYYRRAWVQIVPLRIGGGTRLKIVESLAMGTPVISTTIGAQGLYLEHDRDILLADAAPEFVRQTARALESPALRWRLECAGLEAAHARFSWRKIGERLGHRLEALVEERQRSWTDDDPNEPSPEQLASAGSHHRY